MYSCWWSTKKNHRQVHRTELFQTRFVLAGLVRVGLVLTALLLNLLISFKHHLVCQLSWIGGHFGEQDGCLKYFTHEVSPQ